MVKINVALGVYPVGFRIETNIVLDPASFDFGYFYICPLGSK
jgi:hypothetical protein